MNGRERILAIATGAVVLGILIYLSVSKLVLEGAAALDTKAAELEATAKRLESENAKEASYRKRLRDLAARAFGGGELRASEEVRAHLAGMLQASGLGMETLWLQPVTGRRMPGVYREIGWVIRSRGKLEDVVNFVYLLQADPYVHRLENLILTPNARTAEVEIQVKYATLLLEGAEAEKLLAERPREAPPAVAVDSAERRPYDMIVVRDVFRPYIQREAAQVAGVAPSRREYVAPAAASSPDDRYRVVGLPSYGTHQKVYVRDSATGETQTYKPGDAFGEGSVVMVDYRRKPFPDKPHILSGSRVIFQVGQDFWAVELGCSLAQKHRMGTEDLPSQLRPAVEEAAPEPLGSEPPASEPVAPAPGASEAAVPEAAVPSDGAGAAEDPAEK